MLLVREVSSRLFMRSARKYWPICPPSVKSIWKPITGRGTRLPSRGKPGRVYRAADRPSVAWDSPCGGLKLLKRWHLFRHMCSIPARALPRPESRWSCTLEANSSTRLAPISDGRTDAPLLSADRLETGRYELLFCAGDYLRASGAPGRRSCWCRPRRRKRPVRALGRFSRARPRWRRLPGARRRALAPSHSHQLRGACDGGECELWFRGGDRAVSGK